MSTSYCRKPRRASAAHPAAKQTPLIPVTVLSDMLRAIRDTEHAQRINATTERARRKATLLQKRGKQHFSNQNDDEKKQLQSWICLFHHEG